MLCELSSILLLCKTHIPISASDVIQALLLRNKLKSVPWIICFAFTDFSCRHNKWYLEENH